MSQPNTPHTPILNQFEQNMLSFSSNLNTRLSSLEAQVAQLTTLVNALVQSVQSAQMQRSNLADQLEELRQGLIVLSQNLSAFAIDFTEIVNRVSSLEESSMQSEALILNRISALEQQPSAQSLQGRLMALENAAPQLLKLMQQLLPRVTELTDFVANWKHNS